MVGLRRVGEGASSFVLRGELDGRAVGVKVARDSSVGFEREAIARAVAGVGAPIDGAVVDGRHALVFAWIEGEPLSKARVNASRVAHDLGAILARLHLLGFRHGDVKADNVVVSDGRASLIDFGLAAPFGEPLVGGTPASLPPEVLDSADGAFRVGPEADVYALGLVLEELASGAASEPLARLSLSPSPGERPSAAMLAGWDASVPVDAAYLLARLPEIERGAREGRSPPVGVARGYVEGVMRALASLSGRRAIGEPLAPLDEETRRKLLVRVIGRAAEGWRLPAIDDDTLLGALAKSALIPRDLARFGAGDIAGALARLAAHPADEGALAAVAAADPSSMDEGTARVALVVLRRAGRFVEAQAIAAAHPSLTVEACELARAAGDRVSAEARAAKLDDAPRARAARARLAIDRGDLEGASAILAGVPADDPHAAEARAILAWRRGSIDDGLTALDAAKTDDPELVARATLVRGLLLHARGDASAAMRSFTRAADVALAIAAVPLEATARAGAAAAAHDAGRYGDALDAASRAIALLSRLGRHGDAARARLNRAATLVGLGANAEALAEGARAQADAARAGDDQAMAYALFVQSEASLGTASSLELARAGRAKLGAATDEGTLLGLAYEALAGGTIDDRGDRLAATVDGTLARWTWYRASLARGREASLDPLMRASDAEAAPELVGATLAAAVDVARRTGRGDVARALSERLGRLASQVEADVPHGRRAAFAALPWVRAAREGKVEELGLGAGQIDLLSSIARGLRDRTSLGDLLRQVLDGLVLWVGVERGLLLLRAPDGRLVPRVARGLSREDLSGDQLALSTTLATRALSSLEPVVAVDAGAGDAVTASIHALRLRSVLAVPLVARGEALGVVYLDDRVRRGAFGPREVAWVRLLATQAAAAIADARDTLRLRRLARRAERAQRRLEDHLSQAEGALEVARAELAVASRGKQTGKGDPRGTKHRYDAILGDSEAVRRMLSLVDRVTDSADARIPVLVVGESGTGKELVSRAIHANGPRKSHAFVAENCGAIPEPLLESTLFGHVRGAFTGADRARVGLFEIANGGTLLLDEIGEMSLAMQAKLLRVLQEGEVRPVGGERNVKVDVRVIGATHRDLEAMVRDGKFREDLYYRLAVVTVRVPPLRERTEDLPMLVESCLKRFAGKPVRVTKSALGALASAPWPGNVRQLENEVRRALVLCESVLDVEHLSPDILSPRREADATSLRGQVDALERRLVTEALRRAGGNQTHAAKALGVSRFGLQKMLKRLGLTPKSS